MLVSLVIPGHPCAKQWSSLLVALIHKSLSAKLGRLHVNEGITKVMAIVMCVGVLCVLHSNR